MERMTSRLRSGVLLAATGLVLAIGGAPLLASGADHLDAPALGGLTNAAGEFAPHSDRGDRDINDVYVFEGRNTARTAIAVTTNPAINLFGGDFGSNVRYVINIDRDGDAVQDVAYVARFTKRCDAGQFYTVKRYTGTNARTLKHGTLWGAGRTAGDGIGWAKDGGKVFAGRRSDPFFFDLTGFAGTVLGVGTDNLGSEPTDFFAPLDTNAIVIEVKDSSFRATNIGVWATTQYWKNGRWHKGDQMGRPAINTVFNTGLVDADSGDAKNDFNRTAPSRQATAQGGRFRDNVIETLMGLNPALGLGVGYSQAEAEGLADLLLPDILTYDVTKPADFDGSLGGGILNGRALADDVIDAELGIATLGVVTSDGVGAHSDYRSSFPYLGAPH
jgi:hypothetical protein